jgi:kynurenine formamidase
MTTRFAVIALFSIAAGATGSMAVSALVQSAGKERPSMAANAPGATKEQFERWMTELSNWGRWGKDDQLGAANLITEAKRKQALGLARLGTNVSIAHDVVDAKGSDPTYPFALNMLFRAERTFVRDRIDIDYHGGFFTHLDALCHVVYNGKIYNGLDFDKIVTDDGCSKMGINGLNDGVITRGVLIDLPRLKGVPFLEPGTRIYRQDIEAWERQTGVKVGPGDALLVRNGRWARRERLGAEGSVGYDASFLPFLKDRDVSILGSDTAHEMTDNIPGLNVTVIHKFSVVARGMNLLDNVDLDAAAETAARLKRWEFMVMFSPIRVPKGTGSPINPIAVF